MNKFLTILIFSFMALPNNASAETRTLDRIVTFDMKASDFKHQEEDCTAVGDRTICTTIFYHYEIDEQGRLYFVKITAYGMKDSAFSLQPGASESVFICQLDSAFKCSMPELHDQSLDLSAYAVSEQGISVHDKINPWTNPQKAALFLPQIKENISAAVKVETKMMDNLVCYMFDFAALVNEFKLNGRLIDDDSIKLLKPDACLSSFEDICSDPGSRSDELKLAADAHATNTEASEKIAINIRDIDKFCNSIKATKSAMLR